MAQAMLMLMITLSAAAPATLDAPGFFAGNDELSAYLQESAANHPKLKALYAEWQAALKRIPQAKALDDPMFSYAQFVKSRMEQFTMMIEQKLPWFGTRKLRGEQAAAEAEAARLGMFAERNRLFAALKEAYFEYAYLAEQIRVTDAQLELISYAEETVRNKYSFGMATQDEVLRIQTEQASVQDMRAQMEQMRPALAAKLNETLGRPLTDEVPWPQAAAFPPEPPGRALLAELVRARHPDILAMDSTIDSRETGVALAKRKNYPDVTFRVEYMNARYAGRMKEDPLSPGRLMTYKNLVDTATSTMPFDAVNTAIGVYDAGIYSAPGDPPDDKVAVGFSVNLPVWRKRIHGGVQEALQMVNAAEHGKEAAARSLESEAQMALFEIQDAERRHALYSENLIPKATDTYAAIQAAYASGMGDASFLDMLNSEKNLLEFALEQVRSIRDLQQASARLEMLLGGPWSGAAPVTVPASDTEQKQN